ncbi:MAG: hypothetical protein IKZ87_00150 [Actinomycetaceae bacterium]|nr:hypothetical protein [Actinomycetaceae bacterium]
MKTFDCTFRVSSKITRPLRSRNIEAAVWYVMDRVFGDCRFGCLKNRSATVEKIIEYVGDGEQVSYANATLARTNDGRLATYDVVVGVSGIAHVVVDAENKEDADVRGRDYIQATADVGNLRSFPEFSAQLISADEVFAE